MRARGDFEGLKELLKEQLKRASDARDQPQMLELMDELALIYDQQLGRLEQHRRDPRCASCHARIDPYGFALESYDGVGRWRILLEITIPLLRPTIIFLVVVSSIGFLRIFDQVYNMTSNDPGGPLNSTKPLVLMIYQTAFSSYDMGYAAAQTVVLFTILLIVSLLQLWVMRDRA